MALRMVMMLRLWYPLALSTICLKLGSAAMSGSPSLSLALRWLVDDNALSEEELARSAGVSPAAASAFLGRSSGPVHTWLTLVAALRCGLQVRRGQRILPIALPCIPARQRERERAQWQARRFTAFRIQVQRQRPDLSAAEAAAIARGYVASSLERLDADLVAAVGRLEATPVDGGAHGLRAALGQIAQAAQVNAEDLALLAGVSLNGVQNSLGSNGDGRLATAHRLFSALNARLVVQPAGGGLVAIALAAPGAWRPEGPRAGRSVLTPEQIRDRARGGVSLAAIAREAGVSRQRVHAIVRG